MAQESWKKETDETECQTPEGPMLCANNCGFFGSAATNNFCSKCYGDLFMKQKQQQQKFKATPVLPVAHKMPITSTLVQQEHVLEKVDSVGEGCGLKEGCLCQEAANLPPNRCMSCRKRVGLTGFKCRCGGIFCAAHRYSEMHECSFDYRSAGRDAIAMANPVVKAEKIEKI